jgi:hypothetical protein
MNEYENVSKENGNCNSNQNEVNHERELKIKKYDSLSDFYDKIKRIENDRGIRTIT